MGITRRAPSTSEPAGRRAVIAGTGLEWPAGDEWFQPVALAVVAMVVVLAVARLGRLFYH